MSLPQRAAATRDPASGAGQAAAKSSAGKTRTPQPLRPAFPEFVALIALLMGMTAFSIDNLLPAFGAIRADFALADPNRVQVMVYAYLLGIGAAQFFYGPVSDVLGRRPILFAGLAIYAAGSLIALFTTDFNVLIAARVIQGVGAAAGRVLAIAIVRDRFEGREMARIMSLSMMVFLTVPIVAPALGSVILVFGSWHLIFVAMLALALLLWVWFGLRMPETLHPEYRIPFSLRGIGRAVVLTLTTRRSAGYAVAIGLMMGSLMAYVGSASQVFQTDIYKLGHLFPVAFAAVAGIMAVAAFINASLVRRVGMRRLSHGGICGFIATGALMVGSSLAFDGKPPLVLFCALVASAQFLFALTVPNFNSMAMEPLGAVAGTASSFIGGFTTLMSSVLGFFVGRAFDGTVLPLSLGYMVLGAIALGWVLWAEKGRLFGHNP
ncbi:multidrug effflux MFS transporter [Xanthobacter dioxanivorans]|uniref:Bcr/CflA family efflux transporter n=1 Tax=Xanthobacter dioxanivorans TaxID=2528964 RepID=A0A974PKD2_9HYPH|nr:multidrug effflux MFS transporter [Xanthobacter dioxanivorans]QRG04896.1 multidrug effflux MFS transporter [Xanthobacter dioxanivorans]